MHADRARPVRALLILVVVFLAGGLAGAVVGRMALRRELAAPAPGTAITKTEQRRPGTALAADQIPTPLLNLGLTPEEEARLHAIAREWRPRAAKEVDELRAHTSDLENGMFADMLCVLTPAQREQYMTWLQNAKMPAEIIEKRFSVVRAQKCPAT